MTTNKTKVRRYDYGYTDDGHGGGRYLGLIPRHDGKLVRYEDYEALQAECDTLAEALEEISDPIRFMQERLEEGERLNGMAAVQLAEDASYLRDIAIAALDAYRKGGEA